MPVPMPFSKTSENFVWSMVRIASSICALVLLGNTISLAEDKLGEAKLGDDKLGAKEVFFESKVRPLLTKHCVECHGPAEQSGELRLDNQSTVSKGGSLGPAVIPGDLEKSLIIRAIHYNDPKFVMPPKGKLGVDEIAILDEWVRTGAYWPKDKEPSANELLPPAQRIDQIRESHWSYQPIKEVAPPEVKNSSWPKQPIDRFILSALESKGLAPNNPTDRRTLILRACFTLTGLPPTYDEVKAFEADNSPDAFERLIDRLLESKHYGERWARHWLDLARFAETTGYQAGSRDTRYPYAYTYRDYVINAFNDDKPFNEFIIEQLAADQLELNDANRPKLAALGFLTVGRKFMGNPHEIIDDRIDVVTRAFLGTSVACARCHDHKYDPIPTADYYSLYGVFASCQEPADLPLLGEPSTTPGYDEFLAATAEKQKEIDSWLEKKRVSTEEELRSRIADYLIHLAKLKSEGNPKSVKKIGDRGPLRPRAVASWQEFMKSPAAQSHPVWGFLNRFAALPQGTFQEEFKSLLQGTPESLSSLNPSLVESLRESAPESMMDVAQTVGKKLEDIFTQWKELRKKEADATRLPNDSDEALRVALFATDHPTTLNSEQMIALLDQAERNEYNQQLGKIKGVEASHHGSPPRGMVINDNPTPHNPVIFKRGQPGNAGDSVPRRFLQLLSHVDGGKPFTKGSGRLELAQAIANKDNPLTSRILVNRIWQHHFGAGLVPTASDFGARGDKPSHPELLDYLASEFMKDGWSIKRLQKRIMLSATWQQSSEVHRQGETLDPENRLLWHMPRRRLEFEPLRDRLLTATDKLDRRIGGRSVMIHEDATRRGLYAYVDREDIPGLLASFDLPSPDASQATRARTTVPQQALFFINAKFVIGQAEQLAAKSSTIASTDERLKALYRTAFARDPDEQELNMASDFLAAAQAASAAAPPSTVALPVWRYGYGSLAADTNAVRFTPLPHFTGKGWQGSEQFPDPALSYTSLTAEGGHPGNGLAQCTILRWVSPFTGSVSIEGDIKHASDQGDGVQARIVSSKSGNLGNWTAKNNKVTTSVTTVDVAIGDTIDFVVDCGASLDYDSYQWRPRVRVISSTSQDVKANFVWNASKEFEKSSAKLLPSPKLDAWVQLAQVLLLSNEFAFVD
ncbi:MAG: PSD1 and planctomycete cytochrome C domain-containing protein [Planctomycetota bacterium]|nr:PSD1 and planctomycete cytochrome C domain-containing protein [Planctomycetota bacterium]